VVAFFLDENVALRLAHELSEAGFDAFSANQAHKGLDDACLMIVATNLERVLVTTNTSAFLLLHRAWTVWSIAWNLDPQPRHAGLLLFHTASGYDARRMADEISDFVQERDEVFDLTNRAFAWNFCSGWREVR
jgi:hypothetical protein